MAREYYSRLIKQVLDDKLGGRRQARRTKLIEKAVIDLTVGNGE